MSKLDELIERLCPNGVEYKTLGELGNFYGGLTGKSKDDFKNGNSKFITYKNVYENIALKIDIEDRVEIGENENQRTLEYGDVIFTGSSETSDECGFSSVLTCKTDEKLYLNSFCFFFRFDDPNIMNPEFTKHLFRSSNLRYQIGKTASGVTRYNVSKKLMENVCIPVPPLEVQCEIVRILDNFTLFSAELSAELKARLKQYEYYKEELFTFENDFEMIEMSELFPFIRNGFVGKITPYFTTKENGIRYLEGTNIHDGIISDNEELYVTKEFHKKHIKNELKVDDILMVQSGHIGECAVVGEKYQGSNCHALIIMSNGGKCLSKYVVHYFHTFKGTKSLIPAITGGTIKHVLAGKIGKIKIPIPSMEKQYEIVTILDRFEKLCNDISQGLPAEIEARKKQYEYYRDKLLTFKEKTNG